MIRPEGQIHVQRTSGEEHVVIGIVSTQPGFVLGAHTTSSYPIALAGRVPTKVSTMNGAIKAKKVTYDFARLMEGARQVSCSGFGEVMISQM